MDRLTLEGEEYISSKRAAKISGYTKDYIGQLCRAGALSAKMVGRSWYIAEGALKEHRKTYQGDPVIDSSVWDVDHVEEESVPLREIASRYVDKQEQQHKQDLLNSLFELKYEKDDVALFPELLTKKISSNTTQVKIERKEKPLVKKKIESVYTSLPSQHKSSNFTSRESRQLNRSRIYVQEKGKRVEKEKLVLAIPAPVYFAAGVMFVILLSGAFVEQTNFYTKNNDISVLSEKKISIISLNDVGKLIATAVSYLDKTR